MFEDVRTTRGVVCYLVNIIIQKAGKEVRVCELTRVVGQLSIVCSRSQVVVLWGYWRRWEVFVQQMVFVADHFAEELFVGCYEQILEQWNVRGTESAANVTSMWRFSSNDRQTQTHDGVCGRVLSQCHWHAMSPSARSMSSVNLASLPVCTVSTAATSQCLWQSSELLDVTMWLQTAAATSPVVTDHRRSSCNLPLSLTLSFATRTLVSRQRSAPYHRCKKRWEKNKNVKKRKKRAKNKKRLKTL